MQFSDLNFDSSILYSIHSRYDEKLDRLTKEEKIELGKQLSEAGNREVARLVKPVFSNMSMEQGENYFIDLAEKYIEFCKKAKVVEKSEITQKIDQMTPSQEVKGKNFHEINLPEAKDKGNALQSLNSLFHLYEIPQGVKGISQDALESINLSCKQKKEFLADYFPIEKEVEILAQATKFPVMEAALKLIQESLETWDDFVLNDHPFALSTLKQKLKKQLKNLEVLSDIISTVAAEPENARAFMAFLPEMMFNQNDKENPINGEMDLTKSQFKAHFMAKFKREIDLMKAEMPVPLTPDQLKAMRGKSPITSEVIQLQAQLLHAIKEGKSWAASQNSLKQYTVSANTVYKLRRLTTTGKHSAFEGKAGKASAFLKVGKRGEKDVGIMEKIIWDIAVIMGLEQQFVPTALADVRPAGLFMGGKQKAMQWNEKGELKAVAEARPPIRGGIQVAQKGELLHYYMKNPGIKTALLAKSEIIKGTIASAAFGMFDAHEGNIFVTKEGKIKFFDNTRSLPNSNGFLSWEQGFLLPSYRCALLQLPEAHEDLTDAEIKQLKMDFEEYNRKMSQLKVYLNQPQVKKQLKKLPPGWLDMEIALPAMEERIMRMESALNSGKVKNMLQLVEASNPDYRFAFALSYLNDLLNNKQTDTSPYESVHRLTHGMVGYPPYGEILDNLGNSGYDVASIKNLCSDSSLSMEELIDKIRVCRKETEQAFATMDPVELNKRYQEMKVVKAGLFKNAAVDLKDCARDLCQNFVRKQNLETFRRLGMGVMAFNGPFSDAILEAKKFHDDQLLLRQGDKTFVIYQTFCGYRIKDIDLHFAPGKIQVDGKTIKINDFIESLKSVTNPPTFSELPVLSSECIEQFMSDGQEKFILSKIESPPALVLSRPGQAEQKFPAGNAVGKFLVVDHDLNINKECTLAEIIDLYEKTGKGPDI